MKICPLLMLAIIQFGEILISKLPIYLHEPTTPYNQHISSHHFKKIILVLTISKFFCFTSLEHWENLSVWHSLMHPEMCFFQNMFSILNKQCLKSTVEIQQCISITAQNKKQRKDCVGGVNNEGWRITQYWKTDLNLLTLSFRLIHILFLWGFSLFTKNDSNSPDFFFVCHFF